VKRGGDPTPRGRALTTIAGYYAFILIGWNAVLVPTLIRTLERVFHQSDAGFGLFYFLTALLYASGSFGGGLITERIGRRLVLGLAAAILGIGLVLEGAAPAWEALIGASLVLSVGAGAIDAGVNGLFLAVNSQGRGGALNLLHVFFSVGALLSPFAVGQLISAGIDWRLLVAITGIAALPLVILLLVGEMPSGRRGPAVRDPTAVGDQITRRERSLLPFAGLAIGIGCYVAAEMGVSAWMVKFLSSLSVGTASAVLSGFWAGMALGRFLSNWAAERFDYTAFTVCCCLLFTASLVCAVLVPAVSIAAVLFFLGGVFSGPIYPMIMAIGGEIYPHRLARLSGALGSAAVAGSLIYPPLIGIMATRIGLGIGILGAALLGLPAAIAVLFATRLAGRSEESTRLSAVS
jgi:fucose permease